MKTIRLITTDQIDLFPNGQFGIVKTTPKRGGLQKPYKGLILPAP